MAPSPIDSSHSRAVPYQEIVVLDALRQVSIFLVHSKFVLAPPLLWPSPVLPIVNHSFLKLTVTSSVPAVASTSNPSVVNHPANSAPHCSLDPLNDTLLDTKPKYGFPSFVISSHFLISHQSPIQEFS